MTNDLFPRALDFPRLSPLRNYFWPLVKALSRANWAAWLLVALRKQHLPPVSSLSGQARVLGS